MPKTRQQVGMSRLLGYYLNTGFVCGSRCGTVKNPHSFAVSADHRSNFTVLHREWWRVQLSEKFSRGTESTKQNKKNHTNKLGNIAVTLILLWSQCEKHVEILIILNTISCVKIRKQLERFPSKREIIKIPNIPFVHWIPKIKTYTFLRIFTFVYEQFC